MPGTSNTLRRLTIMLALIIGAILPMAAQAKDRHFGDGMYRIGKSLPPGTYRTQAGSDGCYWARLKNFSGEIDGILSNENSDAPTIVTILPSDKGFQTNNCGRWTSNLRQVTKSKVKFGDGAFIIRTDISPGTYRSSEGGDCYWQRVRSWSGGVSSIIANGIGTAHPVVTISSADKGFSSRGCGTWTRF
jgi:hypothetical protein